MARRMGAADLTAWLRAELNGYSDKEELPDYRWATGLPIRLIFDGLFGSRQSYNVSPGDIPESLGNELSKLGLRQPIAELEALASGEENPRTELPAAWLELYRYNISEGKAPHMEGMLLNRASVIVPRTHLLGAIDRIRTSALDLALSLEELSPDVGEANGPRVSDSPVLGDTINLYMTKIFNNDGALSIGPSGSATKVDIDKIEVIVNESGRFLSPNSVDELRRAISEDGGRPEIGPAASSRGCELGALHSQAE